MLIVGSKGFAKEILEILRQLDEVKELNFYDDISKDLPEKLFNKFSVLTHIDLASQYFKKVNNRFALGLGNPVLRMKMHDKFTAIGGVLTSTISPHAHIGSYDIEIGDGANILSGAIISNGTKIGKACILYYNSIITHDCELGDFVEISPGATVLGNCKIGAYSHIGANATILPKIKIGTNVIVGAGAVVTKNIPDNFVVAGVPANKIKSRTPINL